MVCATLLLAGAAFLAGDVPSLALPADPAGPRALSPGWLRAPLWPEDAPRRALSLAVEAGLYAPDYLVLGGLAGLSVGLYAFPPPVNPHAVIGPTYDPGTRDTSQVNQSRWDATVGKSYRLDTVNSLLPTLAGNAAMAGAAGLGFVRKPAFCKLHHAFLGALQAQLSSFVAGELLKSAVGRLRPDYRDRMQRYYCAPGRTAPEGVDCTGVDRNQPMSQRDFDDGRRSFPSGHTVQAFSTATFLVLLVGGEFVWGPDADGVSRVLGVTAQALALGAATLVGVSRYTDHRHHVEDIVAGGMLGGAAALASYAFYFDLDGQPRARLAWVSPMLTRQGAGLGLGGVLP